MLQWVIAILLFVIAFAGMEGFAWAMHRYVMHGVLWCWHESHHQPRSGVFELNDLFAVVFAVPAIACVWLGAHVAAAWLPIGVGMTAYGATYAVFHDGLVHRRFQVPLISQRGFWRPRIQAHRLHHAVKTKHGCVSYGFLWTLPVRELTARLRQIRHP